MFLVLADLDGQEFPLQTVSAEYILRATARAEIAPTDHPKVFRLIPAPIRGLSPAERRRAFVKSGRK